MPETKENTEVVQGNENNRSDDQGGVDVGALSDSARFDLLDLKEELDADEDDLAIVFSPGLC